MKPQYELGEIWELIKMLARARLHKKLGLVIFMYEFIQSIGSGLNPYLALALRERY